MKNQSLLVTILSLIPVFATAQTGQFNFYGKAGIDLTSRFDAIEIAAFAQDNNNELFTSSPSKKNTFSASIFLETTYNLLSQTELGFGIGYIKRNGFNYQRIIKDRENVKIRETYKVNRYSSIPLYLTLKQNHSLNQDTKFYFKSDLGYSLNKTPSTVHNEYRLDKGINDHPYTINFKTKNGLYLGLGVGIEYKSFLAELGYYHTNSAVTYNNYKKVGVNNPIMEDVHRSYNNNALRFSIGLKF
ncbi:hypothetical protein ACFSAV_05265 [Pasteurella oralis]|uniref:Outer membrane protein beta-barrel domain-containing protein n=1 Tax=Pasteurella oralis TaxID=1071947 RepID=A0ABW4NT31_9PAST